MRPSLRCAAGRSGVSAATLPLGALVLLLSTTAPVVARASAPEPPEAASVAPARGPADAAPGPLTEYASLVRRLAEPALPPLQQARLRLRVAALLAGPAEHPDEALRHLQRLLELELPADAPERQRAAAQVRELLALRQRWEATEQILAGAEPLAWDGERAAERIERLRGLSTLRPAPPSLGRIHYLLGLNLLLADEPELAAAAFERALALRPALDLHLPVTQRLQQLRRRWALESATRWAHGALGVLLLLTALGAAAARPWRWLRLGHVIVAMSLAGAWLLLVHALASQLAGSLPRPPTDMFPEPVYAFAGFGQPGDAALHELALSGLAALLGTVLAGVAVARWRRRVTAVLTAGVAGALLFACAVGVFAAQQIEAGAQLVVPAAPAAAFPSATLFRPLPDIEPWILTRPTDFPGLRPDSVDEPVMMRWILERVPAPAEAKEGAPAPGPEHAPAPASAASPGAAP